MVYKQKAVILFILLFMYSCTNKMIDTEKHINNKKLITIGYFAGDTSQIKEIRADMLDQIIYSFLHLKGNKLAIDNAADSLTLVRLVELKKKYPELKILVSLGGWGGCPTCSDVFDTEQGIKEFAASVKNICSTYKVDGIDIDWEYPAIPGYPGHKYRPGDRKNFTKLMIELRRQLGQDKIISFAAGGFPAFVNLSVDWDKVMPVVDHVNVMTYDLVSGFSKQTGHHTALYSTKKQKLSTDFIVKKLLKKGVSPDKIVIGAAFYARVWENVDSVNNGLYNKGNFFDFVPFSEFDVFFGEDDYIFYWDSTAQAPYAYSTKLRRFATFDNEESVKLKVKYAQKTGLKGIMFWEIRTDLPENKLLKALYSATKLQY